MQVPVWSTIKASLQSVWHSKREWGRVASAPLLLWGIGFLSLLMGMFFATEGEWVLEKMSWVMYGICFFIATPVLEIGGYRYAVLGERKENWWALNLNKRFFKFVLYHFLVSGLASLLCIGGVSLFFGITLWESKISPEANGFAAILGVVILYIIIRLSLLKLLISVDRKQPLRTSWHLLKGNVLRVLVITSLVSLPSLIGAFFLALGTGASQQINGDQVFAPLVLLIGGALWLFVWATLTQAYTCVFEVISKENQ